MGLGAPPFCTAAGLGFGPLRMGPVMLMVTWGMDQWERGGLGGDGESKAQLTAAPPARCGKTQGEFTAGLLNCCAKGRAFWGCPSFDTSPASKGHKQLSIAQ